MLHNARQNTQFTSGSKLRDKAAKKFLLVLGYFPTSCDLTDPNEPTHSWSRLKSKHWESILSLLCDLHHVAPWLQSDCTLRLSVFLSEEKTIKDHTSDDLYSNTAHQSSPNWLTHWINYFSSTVHIREDHNHFRSQWMSIFKVAINSSLKKCKLCCLTKFMRLFKKKKKKKA